MPGNEKKTTKNKKQNQKNKKQKKTIIIKIKIKIKKNETINLTKLLYKTTIFNLQKVNIKSFCDKKKIYGGI